MDERADDARWRIEVRAAALGGLLTAAVAFIGLFAIGRITPFEAIRMLEAAAPTIRFLGAATLTGGVTVQALMLTLLSVTASMEHDFRPAHYLRVRRVSMWTTVLIILSMVLLMGLSIPLEEADDLRSLYTTMYYGAILLASALGGLLISIVVMLNSTIRSLVDVLHPDTVSSLIHSRDRAGGSEPGPDGESTDVA